MDTIRATAMIREGILLVVGMDGWCGVGGGRVRIEETPAKMWGGAEGARRAVQRWRIEGMTHSGTGTGRWGCGREVRDLVGVGRAGEGFAGVFRLAGEWVGVAGGLFRAGARALRRMPAWRAESRCR